MLDCIIDNNSHLCILNAFVVRVKTTSASCNDEISYGWNVKGGCDIHRTRTYPCRHI